MPPLPTTHPPHPFVGTPLNEGVPPHPASSIPPTIGNATSSREGVASLPPIPRIDKDAPFPVAQPITTDEGVTPPTTRVKITDTACLEGVTNLCSSKQDSAAATERTAVDLFSGCGGLAHAARLLGFRHLALIESNERCATTLKLNGFTNVVNSLLEHSDLSQYHGADLLTAGPPCQPWSIGGRSLGEEDSRNLWAATVRAIRGIQPKAFLIEMVDGFLRPKFDTARWQLTADLQALGYHVQISKVNAKDYGVPQYRRRCLIMGRRSLLPIRLPKAKSPITLRDALQGLGEPDGTNRHELLGQATSYDGHEPSTLDTQAKTIRAGVHGPGGGNNTVITDNGLRYFTVREMARVQTFPDNYQFDPVWSHAIKEIGNACPPTLAKQWLESLLEDPTTETTTVPENPPLSPGVAETAHDEAMDSLRRELNRRVKLTHILEAHASVLQGLLDNATKTLLTQPRCIDTYILSLHERATDLESHLIPDDHDVRAAIEHSDLSSLKPEARLQVGKAVDRTLELSLLLRTLRQERALATAMAEGRTTTDTLAHLPTYESSRMAEARRAAYQHDVDSSLDATRDGHLQIPRKDLKKTVFFKYSSNAPLDYSGNHPLSKTRHAHYST